MTTTPKPGSAPSARVANAAHSISKVFLCSLLLLPVASRAAYTETYRPQFHFSRKSGSIGDPAGCIRYNNSYHLFWWGHALSPDLVHWVELTQWPMQGGPANMGYWNGSAVVDLQNTSGFGYPAKPAMVAIYTAHDNVTSVEDIRISSSTNYNLFYYYSGNPVATSDATLFRDPDVFWHQPTGRWIMVVVRSLDRRLQIYSSTNLKSWQLRSEFGPANARDQIWEVPGLVQLPVRGDSQNKKWVLFCGKGPNKEQYWVGDFDGTNFTMDATSQAFLSQGTGLEGQVFNDFETSTYGTWTKTGTAFGSGPATGTLAGQQTVIGFLGARLVNSYNGGDASTGTLTSPTFTITNRCINFLIGGGNQPGTACINLIVGGSVVFSSTGQNDEILRWDGWDVSPWAGQTARIQIVDSATGSWGHILVDHIMFSDVLKNQHLEHANWIDWGSDFYAARVFRDYDNVEQCAIWLAWMGNWDYSTSLPTSWGQGAESIPRNLQLVSTAKGFQIVQQPLPRLQTLRGAQNQVGPRKIQNTMGLAEFQPLKNTYELEATFNLHASTQNFGLNLCVGGSDKVVLGYDARTSNLYLDRRASGNVSFDPDFPNIVTAPYSTQAGYIKFHVFIDQSSIEVFVNDGEIVMTSVIFPDPASLGIELFSTNGATTLRSLKAWPLSSIWN